MRQQKRNRYRLLPGGLAEMELTQGFWALVDVDQLHRLLAYKWFASRRRNNVYAMANLRSGKRGNSGQLYMHRFLLPHDREHTDHRNGDGLDNQLENLRPATVQQNVSAVRKLKEQKTSRYRGVSYQGKLREPWWASIVKDRVQYRQRFGTEEEAALWYNEKARELYGEFAVLNVLSVPTTIQ